MPKPQNLARLSDALLVRLENLILAAPLSELTAASRKRGAVSGVRKIIDEQLAVAEALLAEQRHGSSNAVPVPSMLSRDSSRRPSARAVFGKDVASAQDKVEELISNLAGNRKESKRGKK